jgi:CheY-like chemotaxis protein
MGTVLVVDDDRAIRELLRVVLELEGFDVLVAGGGLQALEMLELARQPWVVLMDVMMPGMTGIEVCERLQSVGLDGVPHRVALMTAGLLDDEERPPNARTLLHKPFSLDDMVGMVACLAREVDQTLEDETALPGSLYDVAADHAASAA